MSSILTNTSAMVALQTLRGINKNLAQTQSEISTGKSVATARDNAAVWAISKTMESDVKGFKAISDTLSLGSATVGVARNAAETVTDLLTQMKGLIVNAQEENVDRAKIQTDIVALREQISTVVGAAQFNGLNLVNGGDNIEVLASLDRAGGSVTASRITVTAADLEIGEYDANDVFAAGGGTAIVSAAADTFVMSLDGGGGTNEITFQTGATAFEAGDRISMNVGGRTVSYTISATDVDGTNSIPDMIAVGLKNAIDGLGIDGLQVNYDSASPGVLSFVNDGTDDLTVTGQFSNAGAGGLGALSAIDVNTSAGAAAALGSIETMIETAINAAASFGSAQKRIDTQAEFVKNLTDSLVSGIGALVDADMEAASARLQALQVQQQLATQSLSIANQQPQNILALFR